MIARKTLIAAVALALIAGVAGADVKMTQKQHTDGFAIMGKNQPATDQTVVIWVGKDRMRSDTGAQSVIVRMDEKKLYLVNHKDRTFSVVNLPVDVKQLLPEGMFDQMMEMMKLEAKVTPTDETTKVGGWEARKYQVELSTAMMQTRQEIWATTDIDIDHDRFQMMMEETLNLQPGSHGVIDEMRKIKGVQVKQRTVMSMMGTEIASTSEISSVEEIDAPADTYDPPAGYSQTQFDLMAEMQKAAK